MIICKNCGVELEKDMEYCPICGKAVEASGNRGMSPVKRYTASSFRLNMESGKRSVQRFFSWFKRIFHV